MSISQPETFEGRTAQVKLTEDTAILSTKFGLPNEKAQLGRKIELLTILGQLTKKVSGLIIPKVLESNDPRGVYAIQRARGLNLTEQLGESQGDTKIFLTIPIEQKVRGLITYFRMVGKVNESGYEFRDHKTDSVFIQPDGTLTVVDADGMIKENNPWEYDRLERNGIQDIVINMFSRGLSKTILLVEGEYLVPGGVFTICSHLSEVRSAFVVADRIEGWLNDTYDPINHYPYGSLKNGAKDVSIKKHLITSGMTNAQYDIADANQYLTEALAGHEMEHYLQYKARH